MTTLPEVLATDNLGVGDGFGVGDSFGVADGFGVGLGVNFGVGLGVFDGDGVGDTLVTLVSGVFVTTGFGDTGGFVTFGVCVTSVSLLFDLSTTCLPTVIPISPSILENKLGVCGGFLAYSTFASSASVKSKFSAPAPLTTTSFDSLFQYSSRMSVSVIVDLPVRIMVLTKT